MEILLDTHILLWVICKSDKLKKEIRTIIENEENTIYFSIASVWEIAIKHKIHPEAIPFDEEKLVEYCMEMGFIELNVNNKFIYEIKNLPDIHTDPFDRLLLAQAKVEEMYFLTGDEKLLKYNYDKIIKN